MCGLTGYFYKNNSEIKSDIIFEMLNLQRHRGPDDSGIVGVDTANNIIEEKSINNNENFKINPNLVFGFNRLSILDLSPQGHQPMINFDTNVVLMLNGEVYNAFDYKKELEFKGYKFKGTSDTEVVLNLYLAYGLKGMLKRLNGMFAIVIYDGRDGNIYLIRDRMGIKPLYVLNEDDRISFSSEIKSFKALPNFKLELDKSHLSEFLLFRNTINNSLFKNIVNIIPGTYWEISKNGKISITTYYDIRNEGKKNNFNYGLFSNSLKSSVERQMISDVKLGCQLSGGIDSSIVTAYAAQSMDKGKLETFSIVFNESKFSEKKYIDEVVNKFSLKSHQFKLDAKSYLNLIEESIWHFEQPLNHPNTIGIKLLSREAKKHVTVLLSGEGADETLAGYSRFLNHSNSLFSLNTLKKIIKNRSRIKDFIYSWIDYNKRYVLQTAFVDFSSASELFTEFSVKSALHQRLKIWNSINDQGLNKKRKYEILTYLPDLLMRQDKMSMAHSIENRVPFLDNEMIKASFEIPTKMLINKRNRKYEGKYLLKVLGGKIFNQEFTFREKMGFSIPLKSFFSSKYFQNRWHEEYFPAIKKRGIFKCKSLNNWMRNPDLMSPQQLDSVWLMISFEIWAKLYLD